MYRDIITFKETTPKADLLLLKELCQKEHTNRAGNVMMKELSEYVIVFEGTHEQRGCLSLGYLALNHSDFFKSNVSSWQWEDEFPEESCDLMEELSAEIII